MKSVRILRMEGNGEVSQEQMDLLIYEIKRTLLAALLQEDSISFAHYSKAEALLKKRCRKILSPKCPEQML